MYNVTEHRLGNRTAANVGVGGSPTLLAAANLNRRSLVIQNNGSTNVYLGGSSVSAGGANQGLTLASGAMFTDISSSDAWYAVTGGTTSTVTVVETS
jgi:hypothetical protein